MTVQFTYTASWLREAMPDIASMGTLKVGAVHFDELIVDVSSKHGIALTDWCGIKEKADRRI